MAGRYESHGKAKFANLLPDFPWCYMMIGEKSFIASLFLFLLMLCSANCSSIFMNKLCLLHRLQRVYKVLCGPWTSGASRQRQPIIDTNMIPLKTRVSLTHCLPRGWIKEAKVHPFPHASTRRGISYQRTLLSSLIVIVFLFKW